MGFYERIQSVEDELALIGTSDLQKETGRSVNQWQKIIYEMVDKMWEGDRFHAVREFAFASAIYEWAAINWLDTWGDSLSGSFGAFQGYANNIFDAYLNHPELRCYMTSRGYGKELTKYVRQQKLLKRDEPCRRANSRAPSSRARVPGPAGPYNRSRIPSVPGVFRDRVEKIMRDPVVNVIGKIDLSLDKARRARYGEGSVIWDVPDDTLKWILLCYEGAGEEGKNDRVANWSRLIEKERRDKNPNKRIHFKFAGGARRKATYEALNIPYSTSCKVSELKIRIFVGEIGDAATRLDERPISF